MSMAEINIYKEAANRWRGFVDAMHTNKNLPATEEQKTFMTLWYAENSDPAFINERTMSWKWLVQMAFIDGYEAGFTDRIFKGDV